MDDETNEEEDADMSSRTFPLDLPMALPLRKTTKEPTRRYEDYDEKGKDTKISKIFQLAITALSFLAFGGYLLTLIIMSIRRNTNGGNGNGNGDGNGDGNGNVIIFSVIARANRDRSFVGSSFALKVDSRSAFQIEDID